MDARRAYAWLTDLYKLGMLEIVQEQKTEWSDRGENTGIVYGVNDQEIRRFRLEYATHYDMVFSYLETPMRTRELKEITGLPMKRLEEVLAGLVEEGSVTVVRRAGGKVYNQVKKDVA